MPKAVGRSIPLSPFRKLVVDLMHFSQQVPSVTADREMDLSPLIAARRACAARPSWAVIFAKAFSIMSRAYPVLRRSYLKFPWPRLYEHPHNVVALNVERRLPDEDIVLFCLIRSPENRSLEELDALVRHHKDAPVESLRSYQRAVGMARVPWPVRRWVWWAALNLFGRRRCHNYGTFSLSSVASQGAGLLHLTPVLTSALHYGMFDKQGRIDVRITWDHRVTDGATIARALVDLETILNREMVQELTAAFRIAG
jgi:pyruvate/2-oxoglutarate dehydrogenase complex dihydrolipoamide acyltransferase (E2) component